jgi:hypothetical protein
MVMGCMDATKPSLLRRIIGPPRIWSIYTDVGCEQIRNLPVWEVYFNGEAIPDCVSYDCLVGTVEVHERDEQGRHVVRDDEVMTKWLVGKVTVRWKK